MELLRGSKDNLLGSYGSGEPKFCWFLCAIRVPKFQFLLQHWQVYNPPSSSLNNFIISLPFGCSPFDAIAVFTNAKYWQTTLASSSKPVIVKSALKAKVIEMTSSNSGGCHRLLCTWAVHANLRSLAHGDNVAEAAKIYVVERKTVANSSLRGAAGNACPSEANAPYTHRCRVRQWKTPAQ